MKKEALSILIAALILTFAGNVSGLRLTTNQTIIDNVADLLKHGVDTLLHKTIPEAVAKLPEQSHCK